MFQRTLVRPALERLRDVAWAGGFTRLYVHSPDRLARKYAWQVLLVEELQKCGVEIVFLNRTIGVSPEEDLLLQMQGVIAEFERAKIMERSRRGKRHAARRGSVSVLAAAPYGYRYIRITYRITPRPFVKGPSRGQIRQHCHHRVLFDHSRDQRVR